jgi:hypothetical protein
LELNITNLVPEEVDLGLWHDFDVIHPGQLFVVHVRDQTRSRVA